MPRVRYRQLSCGRNINRQSSSHRRAQRTHTYGAIDSACNPRWPLTAVPATNPRRRGLHTPRITILFFRTSRYSVLIKVWHADTDNEFLLFRAALCRKVQFSVCNHVLHEYSCAIRHAPIFGRTCFVNGLGCLEDKMCILQQLDLLYERRQSHLEVNRGIVARIDHSD